MTAVPTMVVAFRCKDLPTPHVPSTRRTCADCDQVVWVSHGTARAAGPLTIAVCVLCAAARAAAAEVSA